MQNRFAGLCLRCGVMVQAGGGVVDRIDGKWIVRHDFCAELDRTAERYALMRESQPQADTIARPMLPH
jgi:hypothetical protein